MTSAVLRMSRRTDKATDEAALIRRLADFGEEIRHIVAGVHRVKTDNPHVFEGPCPKVPRWDVPGLGGTRKFGCKFTSRPVVDEAWRRRKLKSKLAQQVADPN